MILLAYVLQAFIVNIFSLAIAIFFPFSRWLTEISRWPQNSYVKRSGELQQEGACRYINMQLGKKMFISVSYLNICS